jgi:hypothetical protein
MKYCKVQQKMSQEIDLCQGDSDDNGERPNTASVPLLPRSSKRLRDTEEYWNGPVHNNATGSAEFVFDLELADEVEILVSPQKKRRGDVRRKASIENDAAEESAQILKGVESIEQDADSEDSEQTSRNDGSTNKPSQKLST